MIVTNKVNMDLLQNCYVPAVSAVQNDRYSRNLELTLYSGGESWAVPGDAAVMVHYSKADGTGGQYDTLPDGTVAWSAVENVLTIALAPQVLTAPGPVNLSVSLTVGDAQITTFAILLNVQAEVGAEFDASGDYYYVPRFLPAPAGAEKGQVFRVAALDGQGRVVEVEAVDIKDAREVVFYTPQSLTNDQQEQARKNIGAVTTEEVANALEGRHEMENLLENAVWEQGYLNWSNETASLAQCTNGEVQMAQMVSIVPGAAYLVKYATSNPQYAWMGWHEYDAEGNYLRRIQYSADQMDAYVMENDVPTYNVSYTASADACQFRIFGRTFLYSGSSATEEEIAQAVAAAEATFMLYEAGTGASRLLPLVSESDNGKTMVVRDGIWKAEAGVIPASVNPNIHSVNHRGYHSVAPENTLSAFRLSKEMGFDRVEADVSFTSDGYAVLLHDTTVDRTSDGTGTISELTFAYVRSLDFGSWKSADYAGEQIPAFEEWIALCRRLGLHPYIEIKTPATQTQVEGLVETVKRYGMLEKVTWITAAGAVYLEYVKNVHAKARLGLVCNAVTEDIVSSAAALKNGSNEVFLDVSCGELTEDMVELCVEQDIPVEVWNVDDEETILAADGYVSGFTTDTLIAGAMLWAAER